MQRIERPEKEEYAEEKCGICQVHCPALETCFTVISIHT